VVSRRIVSHADSPGDPASRRVALPVLGQAPATSPATSAGNLGGDHAPHGARVYLETYGCQMNVADSNLLTGILGERGYRRAATPDEADVILLNTCAVREKAEERVVARVQQLKVHRERRGAVIGIAGCMAEHLKEKLLERAPHVDVVAGPDSYRRMPELLDGARGVGASGAPDAAAIDPDTRTPLVDVKLDKGETYEGLSGAAGGDGVSGFVTIQRGCDKFCSFCVVPFTRGRERGVSPREILRQARDYAEAGYREVVLLGQTVNSYRYEDVSFAELLRAVARVEGIERIRFTSPYPVDFTPEVIEAMASEPKICAHVHLPLQSGSDVVLERMRRGYSVADFRALVAELRRAMPDIALSTDILSGFCGETEVDHQATLELMREIRFDSAFMFSYSERSLTRAAKQMADDVAPAEKKRRLAEIIALQETISAEVNRAQLGRRERVLIHARSKRRPDQRIARTGGFKAVIVGAEAGAPGEFADVIIEDSTMATLFGRPVS
jgi:tRNA-2-methylthio-N6-dimethylallyladenosine synthase